MDKSSYIHQNALFVLVVGWELKTEINPGSLGFEGVILSLTEEITRK